MLPIQRYWCPLYHCSWTNFTQNITICAACSGANTICPHPLQVVTWTATQSLQLGGHNTVIFCWILTSLWNTPSCVVLKFPPDKCLTCKWGHGSPMSIPANFQLSTLRVRFRWPSIHYSPPYGGAGIMRYLWVGTPY